MYKDPKDYINGNLVQIVERVVEDITNFIFLCLKTHREGDS